MSPLVGIHPVREALLAGRPLDRVLVAKGAGGARLQELLALCRERGIPVRVEPRDRLDRAANGAIHQGVVAFGAAEKYSSIDETAASGGLHVILDGVEDPHNLGAIIRTAHAAGAAAVVIPERRAAGLTETVLYDTLVNYLISMARTVESAMNRALESIVSVDDPKVSALVGEVFLLEPRINEMEIVIDEHAIRLLRRGAFSDATCPAMGMRTRKSQRLATCSCRPLPSPPSTIADGRVNSTWS